MPSPWQAKDFLEPDYELGKEGGQGVTHKLLIIKAKKKTIGGDYRILPLRKTGRFGFMVSIR